MSTRLEGPLCSAALGYPPTEVNASGANDEVLQRKPRPNSFVRHLAEAEGCGVRAQLFRSPCLALDIDEWEDLQKLAPRIRPGSATARWLMERSQRFEEPSRARL